MADMMTMNAIGTDTVADFWWNAVTNITYTFRFELLAALVFVVGMRMGAFRSKKGKAKFDKAKHKIPGYEKVPAVRKVHKKSVDVVSVDIDSLKEVPPTPEQLRNFAWVLACITQLCPTHAGQALRVYRSAIKEGLELDKVSPDERHQLFQTLMPAAIRANHVLEVEKIFADLKQCGVGISSELLASAVKLYTSKQLFKESLAIFDFAMKGSNIVVKDKSVWSCMLFCAMESKAYHRCALFIDRLQASGVPSPQDFNNMLRLAAHNNDWEASLSLIRDMNKNSVEVYNVQYNTTLATCVDAGKLEQACDLLKDMEQVGGIADVITYNTVMKAHAKVGQIDECFELLGRLQEKGIAPSQVTYGILVDCCINQNQVDRAMKVFSEMAEGGCELNTVLYTMLIKGFVRAGDREGAMKVYKRMRKEPQANVAPDLITFSILIKANCDDDHLEEALMLMGDMTDLGLKPDEVIFNNLLAGCGQHANGKLGKQLYIDMTESGVRPSNVTFSILIRMYQKCKLLDEAVLLLKTEPAKHKVEPEVRLFVQLIQGCVRGRQGRRAIEVYEMLCESSKPTSKSNSIILNTCMTVNMYDTAVELLELAAARRSPVEVSDANTIAEGVMKKGKTQLLQQCLASMQALGLPIDPRFHVQ